jgi:hypothetical protein
VNVHADILDLIHWIRVLLSVGYGANAHNLPQRGALL